MIILCNIRLPTSDNVNQNSLQSEAVKAVEKEVLEEIQDGKLILIS